MENIFFGSKHVVTRKDHLCYYTDTVIHKGSKVRIDTFKEGKKVISKYLSKDVEYLFDTIPSNYDICINQNATITGEVYGNLILIPKCISKKDFQDKYGLYFIEYFARKYTIAQRCDILSDLKLFFTGSILIGFIKRKYARITKKDWFAFDKYDVRVFGKEISKHQYNDFINKEIV